MRIREETRERKQSVTLECYRKTVSVACHADGWLTTRKCFPRGLTCPLSSGNPGKQHSSQAPQDAPLRNPCVTGRLDHAVWTGLIIDVSRGIKTGKVRQSGCPRARAKCKASNSIPGNPFRGSPKVSKGVRSKLECCHRSANALIDVKQRVSFLKPVSQAVMLDVIQAQ